MIDLQLMHELMRSQPFVDTLDGIVAEEMTGRLEYIRQCVRAGNIVDAQKEEARLSVVEDLPVIFRRLAERYKVSS